jgi:branched-chain amino acid transport system substrate-binding protein
MKTLSRLSFAKTLAVAIFAVVGIVGTSNVLAGEVKFGFMLGFTGDYAAWSPPLEDTTKLVVKEINDNGGILGNTLVVIKEDNESKVGPGVRAAQKLINIDKVPVIIGPESDIIVALQDMALNNQVPVITSSAGTEAINENGGTGRYIWRTNASDSFLGIGAAKVMRDTLGYETVVLIVENLEGTQSAANSFANAFERFGGKVLKKVVLTPGQTTYLSELKDAASVESDVVFLAAAQVTGINAVKQIYQRGYDFNMWVAQELLTEDFIAGVGVEAADGITSWTPGQDETTDTWAVFSKAYSAMHGEVPQGGWYQAETYDAFVVAALAMIAGGDTTGEAIDSNLAMVANPPGVKVTSFAEGVAALADGKDINYEGPSGSVDFNDHGDAGAPAIKVLTVRNGVWEVDAIIDATSFPAN